MAEHSEPPRDDAKARQWFQAIAKGDPHVFDMCWSIYVFANVLDDLVDRDKPVTHEAVAAAYIALLNTITLNPFFSTHRALLWAPLTSAVASWLAGDEWRRSADESQRTLAPAVAGGAIEFFLTVARLHGGFAHERSLSNFRYYAP